MQINRKPAGPFVHVMMWYDHNTIYEFSGTDDEFALDPSDRAKFAHDLGRQILKDIEAEAAAVPRLRLEIAK